MTGSKGINSSEARNEVGTTPKRPLPPPPPVTRNVFGLRTTPTIGNALEGGARTAVSSSAPETHEPVVGDPYYRITPSTQAVDPRDIDTELRALEVRVSWGTRDVLQVAHLCPPRPFVVGQRAADDDHAPDFELDSGFLGCERITLAQPNGEGVVVHVPTGARLSVGDANGRREHEAMTSELRVSSDEPGALAYSVREGETARIEWKGFVYEVRGVSAAKPIARSRPIERGPLLLVGLVGALVAGAFGITSMLMPHESMLGGEILRLDDRYVAALIEAREQVQERVELAASESAASAAGQAARDDSGEAGDRQVRDLHGRMANRGDRDPAEATLTTHHGGPQDNAVVSAVATIATLFGNGPSSEYASTTPVGADSLSAIGQLLGVAPGSGGGMGGLGLVGSGLGSGGDGRGTYGTGDGDRGIGPGRLAEGYGNCDSGNCEPGLRDRGAVVPRVPVPTSVEVAGGLGADAIRRVISRNIAQVRHCYEQALQGNPALAGRVNVAFVIGPMGAVVSSRAVGGDLAGSAVGTCVVSSVRRWNFPQPDGGGMVSVQFPFTFSADHP